MSRTYSLYWKLKSSLVWWVRTPCIHSSIPLKLGTQVSPSASWSTSWSGISTRSMLLFFIAECGTPDFYRSHLLFPTYFTTSRLLNVLSLFTSESRHITRVEILCGSGHLSSRYYLFANLWINSHDRQSIVVNALEKLILHPLDAMFIVLKVKIMACILVFVQFKGLSSESTMPCMCVL